MAMVVCKGCCDLMSASCRACGSFFDGCCSCVGHICSGCADFICNPERPFPFAVLFSSLFCLSTMIHALVQFFSNREAFMSCDRPLTAAVFVLFGIFFLHLLFSFYAYFRFMKMSAEHEGTAFQRLWKFLMWDWGMCLYFLVVAFSLVWGGVSLNWSFNSVCLTKVPQSTISIQAALCYTYLVGMFFVTIFWTCCECCRDVSSYTANYSPVKNSHQERAQPTVVVTKVPPLPPKQTFAAPSTYTAYPPQTYPPQAYPPQTHTQAYPPQTHTQPYPPPNQYVY